MFELSETTFSHITFAAPDPGDGTNTKTDDDDTKTTQTGD